jgi:glycosyltransferase involved in cell wall biosynthesis
MPCLNEAETLARCIRKARAAIERLGLHAEVVIADNGSTDGSRRIAREEGARVVEVPVRGYGAALYFGTLGAAGSYIIWRRRRQLRLFEHRRVRHRAAQGAPAARASV